VTGTYLVEVRRATPSDAERHTRKTVAWVAARKRKEAMTPRKLIHMFVGVPDEMLRSIGMIAVLSARLDFIRIQLLEEADQVPLTRRPARDATGSGIGRPTGRGIGTGGPWWLRPAGDRARIGRRRRSRGYQSVGWR
jgi:hypothetical protein